MAVTEVRNSLWTPEGEKLLSEKNVTPVPREELAFWTALHDYAFKYNLSIVCRSCNSAITGQNNDSAKVLAVACQCREFRFLR